MGISLSTVLTLEEETKSVIPCAQHRKNVFSLACCTLLATINVAKIIVFSSSFFNYLCRCKDMRLILEAEEVIIEPGFEVQSGADFEIR